MEESSAYKPIVLHIIQTLMRDYWGPLWNKVKDNPNLLETIPGFFLKPEKLIIYIGRTHIGIEYIGPERLNKIANEPHGVQVEYIDYSLKVCNLLEEIVGFKYENKHNLPLPSISNDLVLPTNAAFDELNKLKWRWAAQEMVMGINMGCVIAPEGQFTRLINARFYDADENGLRTRHVKWLDLIPCRYDDSGEEFDKFSI